MNHLNDTIRLYRLYKKLSQQEMANFLDVTKAYISLIENNKKRPSLVFIEKFSKQFGIPVALLLWEDINEKDIKTNGDKILAPKINMLGKQLQEYFLNKLRANE